ncbi:MAG: choice-of-anchor D domain-containing protein [Synechococcales bacterium]|nr:choice-of-anchor D domain-containing protein [Synechococcales bacterium]
MVQTTHAIQSSQTDLLAAARRGDPQAIALLVHQAFRSRGVAVQATVEGNRLCLNLYADPVPDQESTLRFLQQGISQLGLRSIHTLQVAALRREADPPDWLDEVVLSYPIVASTALPDPEEILQRYLSGREPRNQVAVGRLMTYDTPYGVLINPAPQPPAFELRDRPLPSLRAACPPMLRLLNRNQEMRDAIAALQTGAPIQFYGEDGLGKTALLRALVHHPQQASLFPEGGVYRTVGRLPATDVVQDLFDRLYQIDSTTPVKLTEAELAQALARKPVLVVLDNVRLSADEVETLVALSGVQWVMAAPSCSLWNEGCAIPVGGLPVHDARALVEEWLERSLHAEEYRDVETLCTLLKGHPHRLAQHTALVRKQQTSFAELVQQLEAGFSPEMLTIRASTALPDPERRVLAVLTMLGDESLHPDHLQALAALPNLAPVNELVDRGLVWPEGDRYRLAHNLLQPLEEIWDLNPWVERTVAYLQNWIQRQTQPQAILNQSNTVRRVMELAAAADRWMGVLRLAQLLDPVLYLGGQWGQWQHCWTLGLQAARMVGDRPAEAFALHQLGSRALLMEDSFSAQTFLSQALQIRLELDDYPGAAVSQHNLNQFLEAVPPPESDEAEAEPLPPIATLVTPRRLPLKWLFWGGGAIAVGLVGALIGLVLRPSDLAVRPGALNFPPQTLGTTSRTRDITVRNTTSLPITIGSVALTRGEPEEFAITEDCTARPLPPDETCTIEATFTPQNTGARAATVSLFSRDGDRLRAVTLRGVGEVPQASLSPDPLTFEPQLISAKDVPPQVMTLRNSGAVSFTVGRVEFTGEKGDRFKILSDGCTGQTLEQRGTCEVTVGFAPDTPGDYTADLVVTDSTGNYGWTIATTATAQLAAPGVSPGSVGFGRHMVGSIPARTITLTNTSGGVLQVGAINIEGDRGQFRIVNNQCSRAELEAGASCQITVEFSPTRAANYSAALVIADNAVNGPRRVALSGSGAPVPAAAPAIAPNPLAFGDRAVGSTTQEAVTITNQGSGPLRIESLQLAEAGEDFRIVEETCTASGIGPGASCAVTVAFTPQSGGDRANTLMIRDGGSGGDRAIGLRGVGVPQQAEVEAAPPQILLLERSQAEAIAPGEPAELCYGVANATRVSLQDAAGGVRPLEPSNRNCLTVSPRETTTYTLVAENGDGQQITRQVSVAVVQPPNDTAAPDTPQAIAPGANKQTEPLVCEQSPVVLRWNGVTDPSGPVEYAVTLQREEAPSVETNPAGDPQWVTVINQTTSSTSLDVSAQSKTYLLHRWQVRAKDAVGNASAASDWQYFWCILP